MKITTRALAAVAAAALFATACGTAPEDTASPESEPDATATATTSESETAEPTAEPVDFTACQVTDTGGVDDRSFNQTAYKGMQDAEAELGVAIQVLESQSETDFEPNINQFVSQGCNLVVTVGFLLGDATEAAAQANPDTELRHRRLRLREHLPEPARASPSPPTRRRSWPATRRHGDRDRQGRYLRRHQHPDRLDLHGRVPGGRPLPQPGEGHQRRGAGLGRQRRAVHR